MSTSAMGSRASDQLVDLGRLEACVRRHGEVVGERLDALLGLPAGGGEPTVVVDETAGLHPVDERDELRRGEVVDPAEPLGGHAHLEGDEDVGLEAADALGHQGRDVPVTTVLTQQRGRVEELCHRFLGDGERPQRGVHRSSLEGCARRGLRQQLHRSGEPRCVDEAAEDPTQGRRAALLAGEDCRLRRGRVPDLRDVAGDLARREVVEERVDDVGRDGGTEGRGSAGEVGVPVVREPQSEHRLVGLVRGVGDDPDRLDELEHPAGQRVHADRR